MTKLVMRLGLFLCCYFQVGSAFAVPLTLEQLDLLAGYLECRTACEHGKRALFEECLGVCSLPGADVDKNRDGTVDAVDHRLGLLELWDEGTGSHVCYAAGAVVPIQACHPEQCESQLGAEECADTDDDGVFAWQEELLGTSDLAPQTACSSGLECSGFVEYCGYSDVVNRVLCLPRACQIEGSQCTAFHLESVSQDSRELVVRVHFDHAPVPPTTLDLQLAYNQADLTLIDARPLPALIQRGKNLQVKHTSNGVLRLIVIGPGSTRPIDPGPIIELVFERESSFATQVAFVTSDVAQTLALAPSQQAYQTNLRNDALWGPAVRAPAAAPGSPGLVLHYSFENPSAPLSYANVKGAESLCTVIAGCSQLQVSDPQEVSDPQDELEHQRQIARYEALQRGRVDAPLGIPGVTGRGVFLDGLANHLELPVTLNDPASGQAYDPAAQSFSMSTWFYPERDADRTTDLHRAKILFSHTSQATERTRFGLALVQGSTGTFDLTWFEGDLQDADASDIHFTVVGAGLPERVWQHVGVAIDAQARRAEVFLNGASALEVSLAAAPTLACPGFEPSPGTGIVLSNLGDAPGSRRPEAILFASARNNLLGVESMTPSGLDRTELIRAADSSAADPDYSPLVDRIVYSSTASGNREIWIAHGDGSNPLPITQGFGDTTRGIFARRPRWALDASGIVFESNVFDVLAEHNSFARASQLYYVAYDATANAVAIPAPNDGPSLGILDYSTLRAAQSIADYQITQDGNVAVTHAQWLRGPENANLGTLLVNQLDTSTDQVRVARVILGNPIRGSSATPEPLAIEQPFANVSVIAARSRAGTVPLQRLLLKREFVAYEPTAELELVETDRGVRVRYTPSAFEATCWDRNRNRICDTSDEDGNRDGRCDTDDCAAIALEDVYLALGPGVEPLIDADGGVVAEAGNFGGVSKELRVVQQHTSAERRLKIEVLSPLDNDPLPRGAVIAEIPLAGGVSAGSELLQRRVQQELFVQTGSDAPQPFVLDASVEYVLDGAFSPDLERLVLSVISDARPRIVTAGVLGTQSMQVISNTPVKVQGLSWSSIEKTYPCNWIGAYRNPASGTFVSAFRGGLDELKVYNYVRNSGAFSSDAARGHERLERDGKASAVDPQVGTCGSHTECPPYELCLAGQCNRVECDPRAAYPCETGSCTPLPIPSGADGERLAWVCSVECNTDAQCFEQQCLNGPCRFCGEQTASCLECRPRVDDFGSFQLEYIEGCPDRNSFACESGSCTSECYRTDDGASEYLCNPAMEFCRNGKCVLYDWNWNDLEPATLSGLGEVSFEREGLPTTEAISQLYPIAIRAFGVEDYLTSPVLVVEGLKHTPGGQVFGADWFDIGMLHVHHRTQRAADADPYVLQTPYPVSHLRLRLITPPTRNYTQAATGLLARDAHFCPFDAASDACFRRAPGSRALLGYRVGVTELSARQACSERGLPDCGFDGRGTEFFHGGQPAVIVTRLEVAGTGVTLSATSNCSGGRVPGGAVCNRICSYEGTSQPLTPEGRPRFLYYGDASQEQSNQRASFYPSSAATSLVSFDTVAHGFALLNCNFANQETPTDLAHLEVPVPAGIFPTSVTQSAGRITENANGCRVDVAPSGAQAVYEPCYEWTGADVTTDYMVANAEPYRTLDFQRFRSFGFDCPANNPETCQP